MLYCMYLSNIYLVSLHHCCFPISQRSSLARGWCGPDACIDPSRSRRFRTTIAAERSRPELVRRSRLLVVRCSLRVSGVRSCRSGDEESRPRSVRLDFVGVRGETQGEIRQGVRQSMYSALHPLFFFLVIYSVSSAPLYLRFFVHT